MPHKDHMPGDAELLALADGQLDRDPAYKARVEEAIARDPVLARRAEIYRAQTEALRRAFEPRLSEPIPPRLLAALDGRKSAGPGRRALGIAATVALAIGAGGLGWTAAQFQPAPSAPWEQWGTAVIGNTDLGIGRVAANGRQQGMTLVSEGDGQVPEWLAREIAVNLRLPDLSALGFRLVSRQEVEVGGVRALRLDYRDADGRVFNLFLRPRWNEDAPGLRVMEKDGVAFASWKDGPLTSAVATRLPRTEAIAIATMVRRALRERAQTAGASGQPSSSESAPAAVPALPPRLEPSLRPHTGPETHPDLKPIVPDAESDKRTSIPRPVPGMPVKVHPVADEAAVRLDGR